MITPQQIDQLIRHSDRIAGAFERIAGALEKANELEQSQPELMEQKMTAMIGKLQAALGGSALGGGFPVQPYRSDVASLVPFPPAPGDDVVDNVEPPHA